MCNIGPDVHKSIASKFQTNASGGKLLVNPIESPQSSIRPVIRWEWDRSAFAPERTWTPELAYTVGVCLGDGSITRNWITIELSMKDRDILETVARFVGISEQAIRMTARKKDGVIVGETATLKLCGRSAVIDFLARTGLCSPGAKHCVITVPPMLPDEVMADFLRGLIDTDGTVVAPARRSPQIVLYSNSLELLVQLQIRVGFLVGSIRLGALHEKACRGTHMWAITGHEAKSLAEWLWPNSGWVGGKRKALEAAKKVLTWVPRRAPRAKTRRA